MLRKALSGFKSDKKIKEQTDYKLSQLMLGRFQLNQFLFNKKVLNSTEALSSIVLRMKQAIVHVFFPHHCLFCDLELLPEEQGVCVFCGAAIKRTYSVVETPCELKPFGLAIYSLFFYQKKHPSQALLHAMKYHHNATLCLHYGAEMAKQLDNKILLPECLIPVPLHPRKKIKRGYNQSELIAQGMIGKIPTLKLEKRGILRIKNNESQTKKNRTHRREGVSQAFLIDDKVINQYSHIGIVDDVITTGATLKEIIELLLKIQPQLRITIFVLGITE